MSYSGLRTLGAGSLLTSMIFCAMTIATIDRRLWTAAGWAATAATLSWIGLIHADSIGWGKAPSAAIGYLLVAALMAVMSRFVGEDAPA